MRQYPATWIMEGDQVGGRIVRALRLESPNVRQGEHVGAVVLTFKDGSTERVRADALVTIESRGYVVPAVERVARRTRIVPETNATDGAGDWQGDAWESRQADMRAFAQELADAVTQEREQ